jgi:hypothetical protein
MNRDGRQRLQMNHRQYMQHCEQRAARLRLIEQALKIALLALTLAIALHHR